MNLPPHYRPKHVAGVWRVPYQERASDARKWAKEHGISPADNDATRVLLLLIDVQNTFCIPEFELFVGGRSGLGAVEDNRRLCAFIYRNLGRITRICPTLDTHRAMQIFHSIFLVDRDGHHPAPYTAVTVDDIARGRWRFNPSLAPGLGIDAGDGQAHLAHYARTLAKGGKYALTVWPYHAMLGGIGHALVSAVEEAVFFHSIARLSPTDFQIKGGHPLTEHYSALGPEVRTSAEGEPVMGKNQHLIDNLLAFDAVIIAGQAKSHCVAWTISDLLEDILETDRRLAEKIYLLEDASSPVVIPGVIDYTDEADSAYARFAAAGMHRVSTADPMANWPGILSGP